MVSGVGSEPHVINGIQTSREESGRIVRVTESNKCTVETNVSVGVPLRGRGIDGGRHRVGGRWKDQPRSLFGEYIQQQEDTGKSWVEAVDIHSGHPGGVMRSASLWS